MEENTLMKTSKWILLLLLMGHGHVGVAITDVMTNSCTPEFTPLPLVPVVAPVEKCIVARWPVI